MFLTHEAHRSRLSDYLPDIGETYWRVAQVVINQPWFVVKAVHTERCEEGEETRTHRTMLFSSIVDIDDAMRGKTAHVLQVAAAFIVTPAYMNNTDGWKMERLSAVWTAKEPREPTQTVHIFETVEGNAYSTSALDTSVGELRYRMLRLVFQS
ncbi:hypothetical protein DT070_05175 [Polaromonas sp. SP1]|nr:hypothetical protein DT070_05175 [Polaromonas sp. SP1]QGJ17685.1 hypothetical protein F7R28_04275 [Polaromonas sp. Pch-P]